MKSQLALFSALALGVSFVGIAGAWTLEDEKDKSDEKKAPATAEVGKKAPDFELKDLDGKVHKLSDLEGKVVILEWFNPECPYVVHLHERGAFKTMGNDLNEKEDFAWFAINSGAPGEQGSGLEKNRRYVERWNMEYPLLLDEDGTVGRKYRARTSPHMYIIDKEGILVYAGAIDNVPMGRLRSEDGEDAEEVNYVKQALKQLAAGETISPNETRPYGCTVKYAHNDRGQRGARSRGERGQRGRGAPGRGRGRGG